MEANSRSDECSLERRYEEVLKLREAVKKAEHS